MEKIFHQRRLKEIEGEDEKRKQEIRNLAREIIGKVKDKIEKNSTERFKVTFYDEVRCCLSQGWGGWRILKIIKNRDLVFDPERERQITIIRGHEADGPLFVQFTEKIVNDTEIKQEGLVDKTSSDATLIAVMYEFLEEIEEDWKPITSEPS